MDRIEVPESFDEFSDEQLVELKERLRAEAESLAVEAAASDETLAEVERLADEFERVSAELAARAAGVERAARAEQLLGRFVEVDDGDAASAAEREPAGEVVASASEDVAVTSAVGDGDGGDEEGSVDSSEPEPVGVFALEKHRPTAVAPVDLSGGSSFSVIRATNSAPGFNEGTELDLRSLAEAIARKHHGMSNLPTGTYERVVVGTMRGDYGGRRVGSGPEENFSVFSQIQREAQALVAAGGNCAPLAPSYDFFRLAEALNPVESCLPVVEAPRGGIRFITPPNFRDAAGGVRVTTEAEDAAGYPPTDPKPCVRVTCPPVEECRVDAVSECVTFGNLNHRVFPEQVEAFLADLNVIFTERKEVFYLDAIDAASTAVTSNGPYGATRSLVWDLAQAAAGYRRRNHMAADAPLQVLLPSWLIELVKVDMVNDHSMGLGFVCDPTMEKLDCFLRDLGLVACWYYDSATGAGQAFNGAQAAGPLNRFPTTVVSYLFAPGTFVRLDGGTLDLGIVRDSTLNGTNDLQMFSEQWIQVCMVGLESVRLESTLCPDGTAPEPAVPVTCP